MFTNYNYTQPTLGLSVTFSLTSHQNIRIKNKYNMMP